MTTANTNLLLDNGAQPANGVQQVVMWYGGPLNVNVNGVFGGATVEIVACGRIPEDLDDLAPADWISLASLTANGQFISENMNPCILSARVASTSGTTRVRAQVF